MSDITISAAGLRIMKLLVGRRPRSISSLVEEIGVTRTAVSEQLDELLAAGFIEQGVERLSGRGRPRHVYKATGAAMRFLFASRHTFLVPAIWKAIREEGGDSVIEKVLDRVSSTMVEYYRGLVSAKRPRERLQQVIDVLANEGCLIEVVENDGHTLLYRRSCPFFNMADEGRHICRIDEIVLNQLLGRPVRQTACRHDGAPCCTFEISDEKA